MKYFFLLLLLLSLTVDAQTVFLSDDFSVQGPSAKDVPGWTFTVPAGESAHLEIKTLYACPPDVDALMNIETKSGSFAYAAFVFDGGHRVQSPPDMNSDLPPLAQNFVPIWPKGLTDVELPGRGILFPRTVLMLEYFFIAGKEDVTFTVQLRQKAESKFKSTLHWGKAEFVTQ